MGTGFETDGIRDDGTGNRTHVSCDGHLMDMGLRLVMEGRPPIEVGGYAEASRIYGERRDESGEGASTFAEGWIVDEDGERIARISYNGRIWPPRPWNSGDEPLWDSRMGNDAC